MLEFTRMTGNLIKAMRLCPQPIIAAIDGICAGAGAMMALAADMLKARPDALRLSKRSFDATLDAVSLDTAMEIEERAQMLMIARRGAG
jgi:enoyl-CoA hydratase/carnithine racemase